TMEYAYDVLKKLGRAEIVTGTVSSLLVENPENTHFRVTGVKLDDGRTYSSDLTVFAAGAKSPMLIDMRGIAVASGEVLSYMTLSPEENNRLRGMPAIINLRKGWFVIPPNGNELKIARHGQGFLNPRHFSHPRIDGDIELSIPSWDTYDEERMLEQGLGACREALEELIPWLAKREFDRTRVCWYTDTAKGDFIIDYHPSFDRLFIATGGSGHAFKFMPVIGRRIVDAIQRRLDTNYQQLWSWPEQ
ncbi:FAD dependent oxidoreductase, partial [Periconia macrospinosa]